MNIEYKVNAPLDAQDVADVFRRSGIRRPSDVGRIRRMIAGANLTISAWLDGRLVGIARALTDHSYCCYLSDLAVDAALQRGGIGKELVRRLRNELSEEVMLLLLAAPEAMDYYPRLGFEKNDRAWYLPRAR